MTEIPETIFASVPMKWVGPLKISGNIVNEDVSVPLATYETPLWPSVNRGARVSTFSDEGIRATLVDERMTRSILVESPHAEYSLQVVAGLKQSWDQITQVAAEGSRFAELIDMHHEITGNLLFLRFEFLTGDASGHNMVTAASDRLMSHILTQFPQLTYESVSGNFCVDKKASAVNGILGRGKNVVTELLIPKKVVSRFLKTDAEKIVQLNIRKNLIGTNLAGGLRSANAHYANMLLGFYLATGQDAANIVEGSQGIVHAENRDGDLYFSCSIPNLIVGTVGNGKGLPFVQENLEKLGCTAERSPGDNGRRLAVIAAATVLCGELSLLAAQTNPGELMKAHIEIERKQNLS